MITGLFLSVISFLIELITDPLPESAFDMPGASSLVSSAAAWVGPLNAYVPVDSVFVMLDLLVTLWLPAVIVYTTVNWVYRHIPVLGGGG